jgi:hypothetical protein
MHVPKLKADCHTTPPPREARKAALETLAGSKPVPDWLARPIHQGVLLVRCTRRAQRFAGAVQDLSTDLKSEAAALTREAARLEALEAHWRSLLNPRRLPGIEGIIPQPLDRWLSAAKMRAERLRQDSHVAEALRDLVAGKHSLLRAIGWLEAEALCAIVVLELHRRLHGRKPNPKTEANQQACEYIWLAAGGGPSDGETPLAHWEHYLNVARGKITDVQVGLQARLVVHNAIYAIRPRKFSEIVACDRGVKSSDTKGTTRDNRGEP